MLNFKSFKKLSTFSKVSIIIIVVLRPSFSVKRGHVDLLVLANKKCPLKNSLFLACHTLALISLVQGQAISSRQFPTVGKSCNVCHYPVLMKEKDQERNIRHKSLSGPTFFFINGNKLRISCIAGLLEWILPVRKNLPLTSVWIKHSAHSFLSIFSFRFFPFCHV